jgi:hypothetical protein
MIHYLFEYYYLLIIILFVTLWQIIFAYRPSMASTLRAAFIRKPSNSVFLTELWLRSKATL